MTNSFALPRVGANSRRFASSADSSPAAAVQNMRTNRVQKQAQRRATRLVPQSRKLRLFHSGIDRTVIAIDTKGKHLLPEDSRRKLFDIDSTGEQSRILLRMISEGQWHVSPSGQVGQHGSVGYTVWSWANGRLNAALCQDAKDAVDSCSRSRPRQQREALSDCLDWA